MDYAAYVAAFNAGDDAALVARFYAPDCAMHSASRLVEGREGLRAFLDWAHDGVREIMRPREVLREGDRLFADVDMDFICHAPRPDFPFGAMLPGDILTVRFFAHYALDAGGRIRLLTTMAWPPGHGVRRAPLLSGSAGGRAAYGAYTAAFSHGDIERAGRYYTEDCTLDLPNLPRMDGRGAILAFYGAMFARVREQLTIHSLTVEDDRIVADCTSRFVALADAPDFVVAPLEAGQWVETRVTVDYALRDGLICRIVVTRGGG